MIYRFLSLLIIISGNCNISRNAAFPLKTTSRLPWQKKTFYSRISLILSEETVSLPEKINHMRMSDTLAIHSDTPVEVMRFLVSLVVRETIGKKAVSFAYDAELPVPVPDEPLRCAIDTCAETCNSVIEPHLASIATISCHISTMVPGESVVLFGLSLCIIQHTSGPCIFTGNVVIDKTVRGIKEGVVPTIARACLLECVSILTGRFERWEYGSLNDVAVMS